MSEIIENTRRAGGATRLISHHGWCFSTIPESSVIEFKQNGRLLIYAHGIHRTRP
jgi:hypothetical protein